MKIVTIIGARPQFIKASVVSLAFSQSPYIEEVIIHTGQHYDDNMSSVFFESLKIPNPKYIFSDNGTSHGAMTGNMLIKIEEVLFGEKPDYVMVYGDTNSTLAGALAASKLHIPVIHVEAGLRSFNMRMPEEINRILVDNISSLLFCPTDVACKNLINEGVNRKIGRVVKVGDVMQDAAHLFSKNASAPYENLPQEFILATLHRAENTDDYDCLKNIVDALNEIHTNIAPVVLPLHPRTQKKIDAFSLKLKVKRIAPVGYFEMIWLLQHCNLVLTDSGGVQKEAFFFNKACVTMREQTEWVELVEVGANTLVGAISDRIIDAAKKNFARRVEDEQQLYGGGRASQLILDEMLRCDGLNLGGDAKKLNIV